MADTATKRSGKGGRLLAALTLVAALTGLGAVAGDASAQPWGRGGGYGYREAAYQERGQDRGQGWRGREGYADRQRGGRYDGAPASYAGPSGGGGWRRGQVLPQDYRDRAVSDPGRYHLRAPPSGYGWVGDERNAYLMQRSTGMVLDAVPGAYEPPPRYEPRGRRGRR